MAIKGGQPRNDQGQFTSNKSTNWGLVALTFAGVVVAIVALTPLDLIGATLGVGGAVIDGILNGALSFTVGWAGFVKIFPLGTFGLASDLGSIGAEISAPLAIVLAGAGILFKKN